MGLTIKNNGHSRLDSTATMLNQAVVEQLINGINNKEFFSVTSASIRGLQRRRRKHELDHR